MMNYFIYLTIIIGLCLGAKPIANPGVDQVVGPGDVVQLDGRASYDPEGTSLTYQWYVPEGITLDDPTSPTPTFTTPDNLGTFSISLQVTDEDGETSNESAGTDLYISEYNEPGNYPEGSTKEGGNTSSRYIEIYNGTSEAIELRNYEIWMRHRGGDWHASPLNKVTGDDGSRLYVLTFNKDTTSASYASNLLAASFGDAEDIYGFNVYATDSLVIGEAPEDTLILGREFFIDCDVLEDVTICEDTWHETFGNGIWDSESFTDCDDDQEICDGDEEWEEDMGDGIWTEGEDFIDCNDDQSICEDDDSWDPNTMGNGVWDNESFIDCNDDQSICEDDDSWDPNTMGDGVWNNGETFTDCNNWNSSLGDGLWSEGEPFIDCDEDQSICEDDDSWNSDTMGDGAWNSGEIFYDCNISISSSGSDNQLVCENNNAIVCSDIWESSMGNGICDEDEFFIDCNNDQSICEDDESGWDATMGNGVWDDGYGALVQLMGTVAYTYGEAVGEGLADNVDTYDPGSCLSEFIFKDSNEDELDVALSSSTDAWLSDTPCEAAVDVCLFKAINKNMEDAYGEYAEKANKFLFYKTSSEIASFEFTHNGCVSNLFYNEEDNLHQSGETFLPSGETLTIINSVESCPFDVFDINYTEWGGLSQMEGRDPFALVKTFDSETMGDGVWSEGEPFTDCGFNDDGNYLCENDSDWDSNIMGNGVYDEGEVFYDCNEDQSICENTNKIIDVFGHNDWDEPIYITNRDEDGNLVQSDASNNTITRKSSIISGNPDWDSSSGFLDSNECEWVSDGENYFNGAGSQDCLMCQNEVLISVSTPPTAVSKLVEDDIKYSEDDEGICDSEIILDAEESSSVTGNLSYEWVQLEIERFIDCNEEEIEIDEIPYIEAGDMCEDMWKDSMGDGAYNEGEPFTDCGFNDEGDYLCEDDSDWDSDTMGNGIYDKEDYNDCGADTICPDDDNYNAPDANGTEGNGRYDEGEPFIDCGLDIGDNYLCSGDDGWDDSMGNGIRDDEDFIDCNDDISICDIWDDSIGNGDWDEEEVLFDCNPDGSICDGDDGWDALLGDGVYSDDGTDAIIDLDQKFKKRATLSTTGVNPGNYKIGLVVSDGLLSSDTAKVVFNISENLCPMAIPNVAVQINNAWTSVDSSILYFEEEPYTDQGNGVYDEGEIFYDTPNFSYGPNFTDCNEDQSICEDDDNWDSETMGNDVWDLGEPYYLDCDADGNYDTNPYESFMDVNGNNIWDEGEPYQDCGDGVYTNGEQFEDEGDENYTCNGSNCEEFVDLNGNGIWDANQLVYLSAHESLDSDGGGQGSLITSYVWAQISGPSVTLNNSDKEIANFVRPSLEDNSGDLVFSLVVSDGIDVSREQLINVRFAAPTAPDTPVISPRVEHELVVISWSSAPERSVDYLTGYYDFEGYKLYRSTDGGVTWGDPSDVIYDSKGDSVGYIPYRQWDYTESQDLSHCIFSDGFCAAGDRRNIDVKGYDQYSYWLNVGENTGLVHSFIDTNVVDGVEYTYALTSYDTGIWTQYIDPTITEYISIDKSCAEDDSDAACAGKKNACINGGFDWNDETDECTVNDCEEDSSGKSTGGVWDDDEGCIKWYESNPKEYINLDGKGFPSMECEIDKEGGKNFVTLIPGYYASNVSFPSESDESNSIFTPDSTNHGTGLVSYQLVNLDELTPKKIRFEIQAGDNSSTNPFESLSSLSPTLYAYYLDDTGQNPDSIQSISYFGLLNSELDSLLDLPGAILEGSETIDSDDDFIHIPVYIEGVEGADVAFIDDLDAWNNWTSDIDGTRMRFLNPWREYGASTYILNLSDPENLMFFEGAGSDYYAPIIGETYYPKKLNRKINYRLKFNYDSTKDTFLGRPPYTYRVIFSRNAEFQASEVVQIGPPGNCAGLDYNTLLPFQVMNTTTGLEVGLRHIDRGYNDGGDDDSPLFAPSQGCEGTGENDPDNFKGDCDCIWTMYEDVVFSGDLVTTKFKPEEHATTTYSLELSYDFAAMLELDLSTTDGWDNLTLYDEGAFVEYGATKWTNNSGANIAIGIKPGSFYDTDDDGANDNPWSPVYPWKDFGDYIYLDIEPWTWFVDGDGWTADLSLLGVVQSFDEDELEKITVSPNPYLGRSSYNETPDTHKLKFSKLPNECEINIYTTSGERVTQIHFRDELYGNYFWNMKNAKGEEVAPGLYIFTVESVDHKHKHIGKFAIVR